MISLFEGFAQKWTGIAQNLHRDFTRFYTKFVVFYGIVKDYIAEEREVIVVPSGQVVATGESLGGTDFYCFLRYKHKIRIPTVETTPAATFEVVTPVRNKIAGVTSVTVYEATQDYMVLHVVVDTNLTQGSQGYLVATSDFTMTIEVPLEE